jgi:hypothetical protein
MGFYDCNPVPNNPAAPTSYLLSVNGSAPIEVPATVNPDNTVQLHYDDGGGLANGSYTAKAAAKNAGGVSAFSAPFDFVIANPVAPAIPTGFRYTP